MGTMHLQAAVEKYLKLAGGFGHPMPLAEFGLPPDELVKMISAWEEDYHLHRHFELIPASPTAPSGATFVINGVPYSAIVFRESIRDALQ